mmetsp:Transcript_28874/g.32381  ORF Transcript_28874/g.32381 Transcript_28874/m.32381 type:complete len:571 (+) Transcript_28874:28-1740(+)
MARNTVKIALPDGSNVDVCTREGAHAFIQSPGPFNFFTTNIESCNEIRKKEKKNRGRRLTPQEKQLLEVTYLVAEGLAESSAPEIFATIPKEEIECWMDHVIEQIAEKTKDPRWIKTGILERHDLFIISPCIPLFMHAVPVKLAFDKGFFEVLGKFVASRKAPLLPCTDIAGSITMLVSNAICSIFFDEKISSNLEKSFKKLEACGMLAQYIRCSTIDDPELIGNIGVLKVYDELIKCSVLIKKKFAPGQPCGEVVSSILNGKKYSMKNIELIKRLKTIASFAEIMQPQKELTHKDGDLTLNRICRYCDKSDPSQEFQNSLKACSKCKSTYYCSKECQVADWKKHKKNCRSNTKASNKAFDATQNAPINFAQKNYAAIVKRLVKVIDESGFKKSELLLELDFTPSNDGIAPTLKDPPEFKISESRGYFEGSRPNEPDWFYKGEDMKIYRENIKSVVAAVKDTFNRITNIHVLCLVRHPSGVSCYRLQLTDSQTGNQMFSDEAVDAVRSAINDGDWDPLSQIFNEGQLEYMKNRLAGIPSSLPDDSEKFDLVRMMLNKNFGADFKLSGDMR